MKLPTIRLRRKTYFVDNRLKEIRNVKNPHDRISFAEGLEIMSHELVDEDCHEDSDPRRER